MQQKWELDRALMHWAMIELISKGGAHLVNSWLSWDGLISKFSYSSL
jgi:hypothetical protein